MKALFAHVPCSEPSGRTQSKFFRARALKRSVPAERSSSSAVKPTELHDVRALVHIVVDSSPTSSWRGKPPAEREPLAALNEVARGFRQSA